MEKLKKRKGFIAVVLALAMMLSMNTAAFASGAAQEYNVDFYDGDVYKTTATLTYNAIGDGLPDCGADGWRFETYLVSDADGTETLQDAYSYTSSADNNVVTQELMDVLSGSVDAGSVGYTLRYKAYTNRGESGGTGDSSVGRNAMSSRANMEENFFETMGYASTHASSKYFSEGSAAPEATVFWFLNQTEELNAYYVYETGYVDIPYQAYMNIANAYFTDAPEMKTYLTDSGCMDADTEQIHYYLGGTGSDWAWVLTAKDYFFENGVSAGCKLRGIFCNGIVTDTTGLTEYEDYYVYNGSAYEIESAVELTLVEDETYGYRIAAYTEKDYYLAQTEEMGDCIYVYNEEIRSFSDVYYCIYSNSGDFGLEFVYEDGTYTKFDNHLCYAVNQEVNWSVVQNGKSYYSYDCDNVYVSRTFEGKRIDTIAGSSGVISGGGEVWLWSTPCIEFKIDASHCTVEVLQGLTDRGDGTYSYCQGDAVELRITPDAGYEVTEVASYLYDEYVVKGTYISASGTWLLNPEFIPSTILVTTKETGGNTATTPTDETVTIVSGADSAASVTVQVPKEEAEKVEGLTLVVEELEKKAEEQTTSLVVKQLGAEEDDVYILEIHFENVDGEETKVNATMVVTVPVPEGWDPANVGVYYVNPETNEVVDMNAVVSEDGKAVTFTTNHFSYYALIQTANETHTHSYGTEWNSDESNHWHQCACGEKADEASHTLNWIIDKEATAAEKGSKHQECAVCGYKGASVEIPATGNTSDTDSTTIPQTGDSGNITLWITLLAVSILGLGAVLFFGRKRRTIR